MARLGIVVRNPIACDTTKLARLGFVPAGRWKLERTSPAFELEHTLAEQRAVYALVVDRSVRYVGICENPKTTLRARMSRYRHRTGGSTNRRVLRLIQKALRSGSSVEIHALVPRHRLHQGSIRVDMVKGLEWPLVKVFKDLWNRSK